MWRITTPEGRVAWYCGEAAEGLDEMVAELFGDGTDVVVEAVG